MFWKTYSPGIRAKRPGLINFIELLALVYLLTAILGCNRNPNSVPEPPLDQVAEAPSAEFSSSVQAGPAPLEVSFTDASANGTATISSWQWDFGDGNTSTERNPTHTYSDAGVYSVSLSVTSADGDDTETKTDFISVEASDLPTNIKVAVVSNKGVVLEDVTIESADFTILSQSDDDLGINLLVEPNEADGVFKVSKPGYVTNYIFTEGTEINRQTRVVLKEKAEPIIFEGFRGGAFIGQDGTGVEIAPEALRRADGSVATGDIELYITPVDISDEIEVSAFPGSFFGTSAIGEPQDQLFSYGVVDITFEQNGEELQLADNEVALLTLPLYATKSFENEDLQDGDEIPLWYLDVETGLWIHESNGQVVNSPLSPNGLALQATTSHFTTFNSDINPPGLSRADASGGGGGGGSNPGSWVCRMNLDLIGASLNKPYLYTIVYSRAGWPASRRDRRFTYTGSQLSQNILRGYYVTVTVSDSEIEGSTSFFCNGSDINTSITLGDQPPEITDFNIRVEPDFERDADGKAEINFNRVYVGAYWVGADEGTIESEILDAPFILSRGVYKEELYGFFDPDPVVFTATVSNEFGTDTAQTTIEFIGEHPPILGYSYATFDVDRNVTELFWMNVEGADTLDIYQLDQLSDPLGIKVIPTVTLNSQEGSEVFPFEIKGYFRLDFSNQYGTSSEFIKIGGADCPPNSDVCIPET